MRVHRLLRELYQAAREQGWTVTPTKGGHLRWENPDGRFTFSSSSPSRQRVLKHTKADLRRAGLDV